MPKRKVRKSSFIRPVHIQAVVFLIIYNVISKAIFFRSVADKSLVINFFGPLVFGLVAGFIFMYLLNHEDFFHFMKEVEKTEKKTETMLVKKYLHHGKVIATFIIIAIAGPVLGAITTRLLIPRYKYWPIIFVVACFISTFISVGLAKGFIQLL